MHLEGEQLLLRNRFCSLFISIITIQMNNAVEFYNISTPDYIFGNLQSARHYTTQKCPVILLFV